ncbi:MAG: ATP-grasp domain-containing protein [Nitriliruptor sp.]|nr:MAG: ATP-grasp domain-containing protein [Nitriliruptor sp.]
MAGGEAGATVSDAGSTIAGPVRLAREVLIANRGEIAVRIARTCRSMGIRTIGVASDVDAAALHVEVCDEVVRLAGSAPADTYLDAAALVEAAVRTGADAVHPGFGFLAEDPSFARAVVAAGLTWIGPSPEVIAAMGDKLEAKRRLAEAGVPLVPGEELPAEPNDEDLRAAAARIGLPVIVKAAAGGGGKGMRAVHHLDDLTDAVAAARREAAGAFGDDRVFLERLIARPRHVEVQIVGDVHGTVRHLHERECSVQRRHQKVVEECPSPGIDEEVRAVLTAAAVAAAAALGYTSAGTVEFVVDEDVLARRRAGEAVAADEAVAFLEVNTRLQVEHPVTEEVVRLRDAATGQLTPIDLVRWQLLLAGGWRLPGRQEDLVASGHAIEVRLYAEDVPAGYLPATGTLTAFGPPELPGIRIETGVRAGDTVTTHYDPMLAKVIATAPTRAEAASRLAAALRTTPLLGVTTNRDLLVAVLEDPAFLAGDTTTAYLTERSEVLAAAGRPGIEYVEVAVAFAAVHRAVLARAAAPVLSSLPAAFSNSGVLWDQEAFEVVGARDGSGGDGSAGVEVVGGDGSAGVEVVGGDASAGDGSTGGGADGAGGDGSAGGGADDAERHRPGGDQREAAPALTVRLRPSRDGRLHAQVLREVPRSHLDVEGEVVRELAVHVHRAGADHLDVEVDGRQRRVAIHRDGDGRLQVGLPGRLPVQLRAVGRFPVRQAAVAEGARLAPMPGVVVTVPVAEGEVVAAGAVLVTLEAMKMEHRITAAHAGRVTEVAVEPGQQVVADEVLVVVEPG